MSGPTSGDEPTAGSELDDFAALPGTEIQSYEEALEVAAHLVGSTRTELHADMMIIVVGPVGQTQVIGTGKNWPPNTEQIIEGPSILVYGRDAIARFKETAKS